MGFPTYPTYVLPGPKGLIYLGSGSREIDNTGHSPWVVWTRCGALGPAMVACVGAGGSISETPLLEACEGRSEGPFSTACGEG